MDKKSSKKSAEIIEITPEVLEERVESIKKKRKARTLEGELMSRLSFAWLSCVTAMWCAFSLIGLAWRFANVLFGLFKHSASNKLFIVGFKGLIVPFGFLGSALVGILSPALGAKIARRMDRVGMNLKSPVYVIVRMMFAKNLNN